MFVVLFYVFIYFCSYSFVTIDQSYFLRYLGQLSKFCQGFIYLFLFGKLKADFIDAGHFWPWYECMIRYAMGVYLAWLYYH